MNCPVCTIPLKMSERSGVEIDYCEKCRGVWLDRGELDKIIASTGQSNSPTPPAHSQRYGSQGQSSHTRHHERENPLADLFDFF